MGWYKVFIETKAGQWVVYASNKQLLENYLNNRKDSIITSTGIQELPSKLDFQKI